MQITNYGNLIIYCSNSDDGPFGMGYEAEGPCSADFRFCNKREQCFLKIYSDKLPQYVDFTDETKKIFDELINSQKPLKITGTTSMRNGLYEIQRVIFYSITRAEANGNLEILVSLENPEALLFIEEENKISSTGYQDMQTELKRIKAYDSVIRGGDYYIDEMEQDEVLPPETTLAAIFNRLSSIVQQVLENGVILANREKMRNEITAFTLSASDLEEITGPKNIFLKLLDLGDEQSFDDAHLGSLAYLNTAIGLFENNLIKEANEDDMSNYLKALNIRGNTFFELALYEEAITDYKTLIKTLDPNEGLTNLLNKSNIMESLGYTLQKMNKDGEALDTYTQGIELMENARSTMKEISIHKENEIISQLFSLYFKRASLYQKLEQNDLAEADFSMAEQNKDPQRLLMELFHQETIKAGRGSVDTSAVSQETRERLRNLYEWANPGRKAMNIFAPDGEKVIFKDREGGSDKDRALAKKHLENGSVYTVDSTVVGESFSYVKLKEIPKVVFNCMYFIKAIH